MSQEISDKGPIMYRIGAWYGYSFSGVLLIYGAVKVILSLMDRTYVDMMNWVGFLFVGLILLAPVMAYSEQKKWGHFGLIGIAGLILLWSAISWAGYESLVIIILSVVALAALLSPQTKNYLATAR